MNATARMALARTIPLTRRCRCLGETLERARRMNEMGMWCGREADEEDGLCEVCRFGCKPNRAHVCTLEEVRLRDMAIDSPS